MKNLLSLFVFVSFGQLGFSQCLPPSGYAHLDVNNVNARMNVGSSSWGDLSTNVASYEVPKGSGVHSFYRGSLWIGGMDEANDLHVAAARFRQNGYDFWPGPISNNGNITPNQCVDNDRIYKLNRWEVAEFRERFNMVGYVIPTDILEWPANGNPNSEAHANAPFFDIDGNGIYNAYDGDYPAFAFNQPVNKDFHLLGDQCLWWIENDMGNVHTETGSEALGVELQHMAYAFSTCDPLNDQTFYRVTAINRGSHNYHDTYVGIWVDADVGFADDDYVACEVMRSIGYAYNGFEMDGYGEPTHYGAHPPAAGIGVLQGPRAVPNDGVDNDRDGTIDEAGEQLMMSKFVYHNNAPGVQGDPDTGTDYYNYMRGVWIDGEPMCYGGTGHPNGGCDVGTPADFMFPGDSDPMGYGTGGASAPLWTEQTAGNAPLDRRFMLSMGPFDFDMGETEIIHYTALWARDTIQTDPAFAAEKLFEAKDLCQEKFDGNYENLDCCPPVAEIHLSQPFVNRFFFSSIEEGDAYSWDFDNGLTSDERFPPVQFFIDNDIHEVRLIVTNNCGSDTAYIDAGTIFFGVEEEQELQAVVDLFPNPSEGDIMVRLTKSGDAFVGIWVFDVVGKQIQARTDFHGKNAVSVFLSSGVYVIKIETETGVVTKKVVVQ